MDGWRWFLQGAYLARDELGPLIRRLGKRIRYWFIASLGSVWRIDRQWRTGGCSWSVNARVRRREMVNVVIASTRKAAINGVGVLFLLHRHQRQRTLCRTRVSRWMNCFSITSIDYPEHSSLSTKPACCTAEHQLMNAGEDTETLRLRKKTWHDVNADHIIKHYQVYLWISWV